MMQEREVIMRKLKCGGLNKFIVIKREDVPAYLDRVERDILSRMLKKIASCRRRKKKNADNEYLVINTDEPYASEIIEILKRNGDWG